MIEIKNISVVFNGREGKIPALSSLNLSIDQGEYLSILGPNGSGKSTLLKAVCGLIPASDGEILIDGAPVVPGKFGRLLFGKVSVVLQEPSGQFLMPSVKTEIISVLQNLGLPENTQLQRLDAIVKQFSLEPLLDLLADNLSGGQMQIINLASAAAVSPGILLLDEPTTFLDRRYRRVLLDYLDDLHGRGLTVIHITQYPEESLRSSRVCVLDRGAIIYDGDPRSCFSDPNLIGGSRLVVPRDLKFEKAFCFDMNNSDAMKSFISRLNHLPGISEANEDSAPGEYPPLISLKNVSYSYENNPFQLNIENLRFYPGQITALVGPAGSGKSTLALLLAGLLKPSKGAIFLNDRPLADYSFKELRLRIGIEWQLPDSVMIGPTVMDDISFILDNLDLKVDHLDQLLSRSGLRGFENRIVDSLSGGEKRKLSLAGLLASSPDFLALDEPAAFLDPFSQNQLSAMIGDIARDGKGILMIGHDLPFIAELAERIIGIRDGRIMFDISARQFFSSDQYLRKLGLPDDPMVTFRQKLAEIGLNIPGATIDPEIVRTYLKNPGRN